MSKLFDTFVDLYYWRDQGEVDFVVLDGGSPLPIQVSWDGLKERHKKALASLLRNTQMR